MADYGDEVDELFGDGLTKAATGLGVADIDEDPEAAATALRLERYTGTPAAVIHGDLEGFQANHKADLVGQMLRNNKHLANYVASFPMASKVSNDDYPELNDLSSAIHDAKWGFGSETLSLLGKNIGKGIVEKFREDFGEGPIGQAREETLRALDMMGTPASPEAIAAFERQPIPLLVNAGQNVLAALTSTVHGVVRGAATTLHQYLESQAQITGWQPDSASKIEREVGGVVDWLMSRGDINLSHGTPKDVREIRKGVEAVEPYVVGGEIPPVGVFPKLDELKVQSAAEDMKTLDKAIAAAGKSKTLERSPDAGEAFIRGQVGDREVGISGEKALELYAEKPPDPDDGMLGWVPDIAKQLEVARETGTDIKVPLAGFLARPEFAKEITEHVRLSPEGMTKFEADNFEPPKVEEPPAPAAPEVKVTKEEGFADIWEVSNDKGFALAHVDPGTKVAKIQVANLPGDIPKGQGHGTVLYRAIIDKALAKGYTVESATAVSQQARHLYEGLKRKGYTVETVNPEGTKGGSGPVYRITAGPSRIPPTMAEGGPDMSRRRFLKGAGATVAAAATVKVPKLAEVNPFEAATPAVNEMFRKNVEFAATEQYAFAQKLYGPEAQKEAVRTLSAMTKRLSGEGANRMFEEAGKLLESGWVPSKELLDKVSKVGRGEGIEPSEMTQKMTKEGGLEEPATAEQGTLPEPTDYMKSGYPEGIIEPGLRRLAQLEEPRTALDTVRREGAYEPPMMVGKPELQLKHTGTKDADGITFDSFELRRGRKSVGTIDLHMRPNGLMIVGNIEGYEGGGPNAFGYHTIKALFDQIKQEYPGVKRIGGYRITGAREAATKAQGVDRLGWTEVPLKEVEDFHGFLNKITGWDKVEPEPAPPPKPGTFKATYQQYTALELRPTDAYSAKEKEILTAAREVLNQIAPGANLLTPDTIKVIGKTSTGTYYPANWNESGRALVMAAMNEASPKKTINTVLHEAIHHLRTGFFKPEEWATLEKAAVDQGWIEKANIRERYPTAPDWIQKEEAVAEGYRLWANENFLKNAVAPKEVVAIFQRIKELFDALRERLYEIFGRKITAEELFTRVTAGEIGRREPTEFGRDRFSTGEPRTSVESMKQIELIRSLAKLEDNMLKQVGKEYSRRDIRGALSDLDALGEHEARTSQINKEILDRIDLDDAKNYMEYINNITHEARSSLQDYQDIHKAHIEEQLSEHRPDPFKKAFDAIDDFKSMSERTESPSIQPGRGDEPPMRGQPLAMAEEPSDFEKATSLEEQEMFAKGAALGMTQVQFKKYLKLIEERRAEDEARAQRRAERAAAVTKTEQWKENEPKVREEVTNEINQRPDVVADEFFRRGMFNGEKIKRQYIGAEFVTADQAAAIGSDVIRKGGINPIDVAGLFGFVSSEHMLETMTKLNEARNESGLSPARFKDRMIKDRLQATMMRRYGVPEYDQLLKEMREDIVSETQMDMLHEETVALATNAGQAPPIAKGDFKSWVGTKFGESRVGTVNDLAMWIREAGKAGRAAELALLKGDALGAFQLKQRQYISTLFAAEAKRLGREMDRADKTFKNLSTHNTIASVDQDYLDQLHRVMDQIGRGNKRNPRELAGALAGKPLEEFVDAKVGELRELPVAAFLFDPAYRKDVKDMTVEEFRAVRDSVKTMLHNARDEQKLWDIDKKAELTALAVEARDQASEISRVYEPRNPGMISRLKSVGYKFDAALLKMEQLMDWMDREAPNGVFNRVVFRRIADAKHVENDLRKEIGGKLKEVPTKGIKWDRGIEHEEILDWKNGDPVSLTERDMIGMMLNVGNEGNFRKLTSEFKYEGHQYNLERDTVMRLIEKNARKEHWDFVQGTWDTFESLWPRIEKLSRDMSGLAPEKIESREINTPFGRYRGGYYPLIADHRWEGPGPSRARGIFGEDKYTRAVPPRGYTKARTETAYPLEFDPNISSQKLMETAHDLAYREALVDAKKFLEHPEVRRAIRNALGPEYLAQVRPWLENVANPAAMRMVSNEALGGINTVARVARERLVAVQLMFRASTIMKHSIAAALDSVGEVGLREFSGEMAHFYAQPWKTKERIAWVMERSGELRNRLHDMDRDIGEMMDRNLGSNGLYASAMHYGAIGVSTLDIGTALPTWMVAYKRALKDDVSEADAVFAGDKAVRAAHGSTGIPDLPAVMRGPDVLRLFTVAYGFFNHNYNRIRNIGRLLGKEGVAGDLATGDIRGAWLKFQRAAWMSTWYIVLMAAIEEAVSPLPGSEKESWGAYVSKGIFHQMSSTMPFIRDMAGYWLGRSRPTDPVSQIGEAVFKPLADLKRYHDGKKTTNVVRHLFEAAGYALAIPGMGQAGVTAQYLADLRSGRQRADSFFLGHGMGTNVIPFGSSTHARGLTLGRSDPHKKLR